MNDAGLPVDPQVRIEPSEHAPGLNRPAIGIDAGGFILVEARDAPRPPSWSLLIHGSFLVFSGPMCGSREGAKHSCKHKQGHGDGNDHVDRGEQKAQHECDQATAGCYPDSSTEVPIENTGRTPPQRQNSTQQRAKEIFRKAPCAPIVAGLPAAERTIGAVDRIG